MSKSISLTKREEEAARLVSKQILGQIISYQDTFKRILDVANDPEMPAAVKLKALSLITDEYQFLRGHEIKVGEKEVKEDLAYLSDEELEELMDEAKKLEVDEM